MAHKKAGSSSKNGRDSVGQRLGVKAHDGTLVPAGSIIVRQGRGDKIVVFKYRPKARTRVKKGHRQDHTILRIDDIVHGEKSAARQAEAARTERQRLEAAAAEEAAKKAAADKALAEKLRREAAPEAETVEKPARRTRAGAAASKSTKAAAPDKATAPGKDGAAKSRGRTTASRTQAPEPESKPRRVPRITRKKDE